MALYVYTYVRTFIHARTHIHRG